jgi:hypothetical protein
MQSYLKKGIHLTMNRLLNDYQRQMILEQLDVDRPVPPTTIDGRRIQPHERPILSALAEYDREINKKSEKLQAALNSVESRVAKDKAYKEYLEEHLGSAIPSIRIY